MCSSCAMTTSRVTLPAEEEEVDVDGAEEAEGATVSVCGRFGRSWASLCVMVAALMVPMMKK